MESYTDIADLLFKHIQQELTEEESARLMAWVSESDVNQQFFSEITNTNDLMRAVQAYNEVQQIDLETAWARLTNRSLATKVKSLPKKINYYSWLGKVAAVLLVLVPFILLSLLLFRHPAKQINARVAVPTLQDDAVPSSSHVYLTRYNGETVVLDGFSGSLMGDQGSVTIKKTHYGELSYTEEDCSMPGERLYNKVTVPKGSNVVKVTLAEGTKVWLNAGSSIRYPVAFHGEERKVTISGEAYFEVNSSYNHSGPFIVVNGALTITVLGTRFNVNAYNNEEDKKVTPLEGKVKVQYAQGDCILQPGEQAIVHKRQIHLAGTVDPEQAIAWKKGRFIFNDTNIQVIMRQMERWYNLDPTRYENAAVKKWEFDGEISRYNNASKVLQLLEKTGCVKFAIEGKRIVVKP